MLIKIKQYTVNFVHRARLILCSHDKEYEWRQMMIKKNLQTKISEFLCSEEYRKSHGFKHLRYNFVYKILLDKHGTINLPDYEIEALARCFLPDILAYFESEEGKAEFEAWKAGKAKTTETERSKKAASQLILSPAGKCDE